MKGFYFSQEEKDISIQFIISSFIYFMIMDCIYWYRFNSFLNKTKYCSEIYSKHKKENINKNQVLEVGIREYIYKNKFPIYKYKLEEVNFSYYEKFIYENKPYEKIIEVESIEQPYEKTIKVENIGQHHETIIEMTNIKNSQKEHIPISQLGCEVDIPIDKIVVFINNIT